VGMFSLTESLSVLGREVSVDMLSTTESLSGIGREFSVGMISTTELLSELLFFSSSSSKTNELFRTRMTLQTVGKSEVSNWCSWFNAFSNPKVSPLIIETDAL